MAARPIFLANFDSNYLVEESVVEFEWHAGLSLSQKQRSIESLHACASAQHPGRKILEISSKSSNPLGVNLSAFNLKATIKALSVPVENAFQSAKVFERGGPFRDLLLASPKEAKTSELLRSSGRLLYFDFDGDIWESTPPTAFYDWLYIRSLADNEILAAKLVDYDTFTDIEFNPERSINCQARSAAIFVSLVKRHLLDEALSDREFYLKKIAGNSVVRSEQRGLF